jgi:diaminohydroxyphosphoribosylaminopyrimidine deaminase/5-amino-6-(5-phosphoribosylamino)uracil reductase
MSSDPHFMSIALNLGARLLGQTAPNPAVGCVIVKDGVIVGRGFTQKGGRPHAETQALVEAGEAAKGAAVYVSLEPCAHQGHTGPCAEALVKAGVARVVIPLEDPDPRVSGKGILILKKAGIDVRVGVMAEEAACLNEGFIKRIRNGRPIFTLKLATTLDGRIATAGGESRWITGEIARAHAHHLRATHDAIMVGIGTAITDNPKLDCRLAGLEDASPVRIVVDRKLQLLPDSYLAQSAKQTPLWLIAAEKADAGRAQQLEQLGAKIIRVPVNEDSYANLVVAARKLGEMDITRVLVEGGAHLAAALLREDLVDRLEWMTAPFVMGDDAKASVKTLGLEQLSQYQRFKRVSSRVLGEDRLESLVRIG